MNVRDWAGRLETFKNDAHKILGQLESSKSRTITLDDSYRKLSGLSVKQDELFRQALRCVENELFRAAHVMAWAGLIDCLHALVESDGFVKLNAARPRWSINSVEQLGESQTEYALIEALEAMNVIGRAEKKALQGMLSKRNECAHAGSYFPGFNETLGYIAEVFSRLTRISHRHPNLAL